MVRLFLSLNKSQRKYIGMMKRHKFSLRVVARRNQILEGAYRVITESEFKKGTIPLIGFESQHLHF